MPHPAQDEPYEAVLVTPPRATEALHVASKSLSQRVGPCCLCILRNPALRLAQGPVADIRYSLSTLLPKVSIQPPRAVSHAF